MDNGIELLRQDWKKIGVDFSVKHYSTAQFFAPLQSGGIVYSTAYDITSFAWLNDTIGDYSTEYGCSSFPPQGQNNVRWCNRVADKAMQDLYTKFDQAQRNADVKTVMDAMYKDAPLIVSMQRQDVWVYNKDVKDFHPNAVRPFDNFMNVDI